MSFWMDTYFMDANSPTMEQMIYFHDHTMIMVTSIMFFLLSIISNLIRNTHLDFNLNDSQVLETIWTIAPMLILLSIAIPSLRLLYLMEEIFHPILTVKVTGHQWYWSYEIPEAEVNFDSFMSNTPGLATFTYLDTDTPMYIPLYTPTRLLITSADVIHSWTIQSLGVKTDAIPGRLNQVNIYPTRPGQYFGQCSEICGLNHSFMPIAMYVSTYLTFYKWMCYLCNEPA